MRRLRAQAAALAVFVRKSCDELSADLKNFFGPRRSFERRERIYWFYSKNVSSRNSFKTLENKINLFRYDL